MKEKIQITLVSHPFEDENLGCSALAISNLKIIDEILDELNVEANYILATTDNLKMPDISTFTKRPFEYRIYPRCRQSIKNPFLLLNTKVFEGSNLAINLCGGDGYTDIYGFARLLAESQLAWIAKRNNVPMIYAPQTIGPFNKSISKKVAKQTLDKLEKIYVRDEKSFNCCKDLSLMTPYKQVIDVAFSLPYKKEKRIKRKRKIGINVSGLLYNGGYNKKNYFNLSINYKDYIHKLIEELQKNKKNEIHLVPHVISQTNEIEDDYRICKQLSEEYSCILAPKFSSPVEAKNYIANLDVFTGARMHSTIAALSSGVPVVPFAYSRKFSGLYNSLNYPYYIDATENITQIDAIKAVLYILEKPQEAEKRIWKANEIYNNALKEYKDDLKNEIKRILEK